MLAIDWDTIMEVHFLHGRHAERSVQATLIRKALSLKPEQEQTIERRLVNLEAAYRIDWLTRDDVPAVRKKAIAKGMSSVERIGRRQFDEAYRALVAYLKPRRHSLWTSLVDDASDSLKRDVGAVQAPSDVESPAEIRPLLSQWPVRSVRDSNPYALGVFRSALAIEMHKDEQPPYVPRAVDALLFTALEARLPIVLVVGPAKAGKSRTAFEAALTSMPDAELLAPRGPLALRRLLDMIESPARNRQLVLWLDEFGRYLKADGIEFSDVERWAASPIPIVAVVDGQIS